MSQFDTQLSGPLENEEQGEGIPAGKGFPFGIAKDPLVPPGDEWWAPMTDEEVDLWIDGKL